MPLTVAQLNIMVEANTTAAQQALAQINAQFQQLAQNATSSATTEAQGQEQVVAALQDVMGAISSTTMAVRNLGATTTAVAQEEQAANQAVASSMVGMGSVGSGALMSINQAMVASGQSIGPLNAGVMMIATNLRLIPPAANAAQGAIMGLSVALSAVGILAAAVGAPAQQGLQQLQNEFNNVGASVHDYQDKLNSAVDQAAKFGRTQDQVYQSLAILTRGLKDPELALERFGLVQDLAAVKGESLSAAANDVVRAFEGYGRGLKQLGIDMVFTHNAQAGLDSANRALQNSTDQVAAAQQRLNDAVQRQNDRMAQAALATDQVAAAQQRLNDANTSYAELLLRISAEDRVPKISATTQALDNLASSTQRLSDIEARYAAQDEAPSLTHRAQAIDSVRVAQQRLLDVQARVRDAMTLTAVDHDAAAQAADRVAEAEERLALASGGGIIAAQNALRAAISQQRQELDRLHAKEQESISQKQELAKANQDLAVAQAKVVTATQQDRADADTKALDRSLAMRDAQNAITRAVQNLSEARKKDAAEGILAQITRTEQLRSATNQVRNSVEALAQARRSTESRAIGGAAGGISVAAAERSLEHAKKVQAEALAHVKDAREKLEVQLHQGVTAMDKMAAATHGAAGAAAQGWSGALNSIKAHFVNFLADFGNSGGRFLTFALPLFFVAKQLSGLFGGAAGAAGAAGGAAEEGGLAAAVASTGEAAGIAFAPIAAIVGLVAAAGLIIYEAYQHVKPFRDIVDALGRDIGGFFSGAIHKVTGFLHTHKQEWHDLGKEVSAAWGFIEPVLQGLANLALHILGPAFTAATAIIKLAFDIIKGIVSTALDIILGVVGVFVDLITGNWGQAWDDIKTMLSNVLDDLWTMITSTLGDIRDFMWNAGKFMLGALADGLTAAWHLVGDWFIDLPNKIWDGLQWLWSNAGTFATAGWNMMVALVGGLIDQLGPGIWTFFTDTLPNAIWDAVKWLWDNTDGAMLSIGKNLVIGIWNGLASMGGWLYDKISGWASDVVDWIGSGFGIFSPSKITQYHGQMLVEGLALGLDSHTHKAITAVRNMTSAVGNELSSGGKKLNVGIGGFGGVGTGIPHGPTLVTMHVNVEGNVWATKDLASALRDEFNKRNKTSGSSFLVADGQRP
jgi:phage-related protein